MAKKKMLLSVLFSTDDTSGLQRTTCFSWHEKGPLWTNSWWHGNEDVTTHSMKSSHTEPSPAATAKGATQSPTGSQIREGQIPASDPELGHAVTHGGSNLGRPNSGSQIPATDLEPGHADTRLNYTPLRQRDPKQRFLSTSVGRSLIDFFCVSHIVRMRTVGGVGEGPTPRQNPIRPALPPPVKDMARSLGRRPGFPCG